MSDSAATATGYRHPRCWASSRDGCDTKISLEHYISNAVLDALGIGSLQGPAFTGGKPGVAIQRKNFGAKVLCRRHNTELSPLDSTAQSFFGTQRRYVTEIGAPHFSPEDEQIDVSGDDLERWLLKTLVTNTAARIFTAGGEKLSLPDLDTVTRLVFEQDPWPPRCGLWMKPRPQSALDLHATIEFEPIWMREGHKLGGGRVMLGGVEFWLSLFPPSSGDGGPFDDATYRPSGIVYRFPGFKKVIGLRWRDGGANPSITYRAHRP